MRPKTRPPSEVVKGWGCLLLLLAFLVGGAYLVMRLSTQHKTARQLAETRHQAWSENREQQRQTFVDAFAREYQAISNWEEQFKGYFTLDLQEIVIREDQRPIIFFSYLQDILKHNDKYFVIFGPDRSWPLLYDRQLYYALECAPQHVMTIRQHPQYHAKLQLAVVAKISSVGKPLFKVEIDSLERNDARTLDIRGGGATFILRGHCLDIRIPPEDPPQDFGDFGFTRTR